MKRNRKPLVFVATIVALAALVLVSNTLRRNQPVRDLKVVITYGAYTAVPKADQAEAPDVDLSRTVDTLVTSTTLREQMLSLAPGMLGVKVKEADADAAVELALRSPYVESATASVNVWGDLVVKAVQRTPVVRLFTDTSEYYLSHDGHLMPLSPEGEADVLVGNGAISNPTPKQLLQTAVWLYDHPLYGSLFDQITLRPDGDMVLSPKVGNHLVVLGPTAEGLDSKMSDLLVFYRKGLRQVGWNTYKEISLKYNGQIICKIR